MSRVQRRFQTVQTIRPEDGISIQPGPDFGEGLRPQGTDLMSSRPGLFDQPCLNQNGDMLGRPRKAHIQRLGQIADRGRSLRQPVEHVATHRIREGFEQRVDIRRFFNHMVE